jgi:hypothetical protein
LQPMQQTKYHILASRLLFLSWPTPLDLGERSTTVSCEEPRSAQEVAAQARIRQAQQKQSTEKSSHI